MFPRPTIRTQTNLYVQNATTQCHFTFYDAKKTRTNDDALYTMKVA